MNRYFKWLLILFVLLLVTIIVARSTKMIDLIKISGASCYPELKSGELKLTTNFGSPGRFDHVSYRSKVNNQLCVGRVCGVSGDIIEIVNGNLYVNAAGVDFTLQLAHDYVLKSDQWLELADKQEFQNCTPIRWYDFVRVDISDGVAQSYNIQSTRWIADKTLVDSLILTTYGKPWNVDNDVSHSDDIAWKQNATPTRDS